MDARKWQKTIELWNVPRLPDERERTGAAGGEQGGRPGAGSPGGKAGKRAGEGGRSTATQRGKGAELIVEIVTTSGDGFQGDCVSDRDECVIVFSRAGDGSYIPTAFIAWPSVLAIRMVPLGTDETVLAGRVLGDVVGDAQGTS